MQNTYDSFQTYFEWVSENLPPVVSDQKQAKSGFFYVHGRDKCFRPIIIIQPRLIIELGVPEDRQVEEILKAAIFVMEYLKKTCHLPGQIENWTTIINVDKMPLA
jgi:hypothetical protein